MPPLLTRLSLALCVSAAFLLLSCTGGGDGPAPPASSAAELAERFAPRLFSGPDDPFGPEDVGIVWNDDASLCRHLDPEPDSCSQRLPTSAAEMEAEGYYLDLPGDVEPQAAAEAYSALEAAYEDTAYGRVKLDQGHLAVQYWFYYYFNDWAADHEGDWEMVQLLFDAAGCTEEESCAEAILDLESEPLSATYAQHSCAETRAWDDVLRDGDHPSVFVATGSHASYFEPFPERPLANPQCAFGIETAADERSARHLSPKVRLLPEVEEAAGTEFEWLRFRGRWGQSTKKGCLGDLCAGPTGPATKERWDGPYAWAQRWAAGP